MSKIFELSNGTIQEVFENGLIKSHSSLKNLSLGDYLETEYFQIKDVYPSVVEENGETVVVFKNGRKELVKNFDKSFYKNKCKMNNGEMK